MNRWSDNISGSNNGNSSSDNNSSCGSITGTTLTSKLTGLVGVLGCNNNSGCGGSSWGNNSGNNNGIFGILFVTVIGNNKKFCR